MTGQGGTWTLARQASRPNQRDHELVTYITWQLELELESVVTDGEELGELGVVQEIETVLSRFAL